MEMYHPKDKCEVQREDNLPVNNDPGFMLPARNVTPDQIKR
jgi:hypothetical protein